MLDNSLTNIHFLMTFPESKDIFNSFDNRRVCSNRHYVVIANLDIAFNLFVLIPFFDSRKLHNLHGYFTDYVLPVKLLRYREYLGQGS